MMATISWLWGIAADYGWLWTSLFLSAFGAMPFLGVLAQKWPSWTGGAS